jgi:hypothetical protein
MTLYDLSYDISQYGDGKKCEDISKLTANETAAAGTVMAGTEAADSADGTVMADRTAWVPTTSAPAA